MVSRSGTSFYGAETCIIWGTLKKEKIGTSLMVQWLRRQAPIAKGLGLIPSQGTRSYILQLKIPHEATEIKDPACHN